MSNDEIIAREKAVQYARNVAHVPSDSASDHCAGFLAGWKAARDHLAAQEPTDAEVRAVWDALGPRATIALEYEELRAVLAAARAARQEKR